MPGKTDIGPKIGIEGEKQFRDQIKEINRDLKTLGSEMKLVTSEFIGNEKSVEALMAKNDVLGRSVISLSDKVKLQEERFNALAKAYKLDDERTQKALQDYNKTKTELNEVNAQIQQNTDAIKTHIDAIVAETDALRENIVAIEDQSDSVEKNSDAATSLSDVLRSRLESGLQTLGSKLGFSSSQVSTLTSGLSGLSSGSLAVAGPLGAAAVAAAKLGSAIVKLTDAAGKHADTINTLATNYNLTTKDIQRFQYMAEMTDVSVETITGSLSRLTRSMDSARSGSGDAAAAFKQLGVSVTNGADDSLRSANDVFMETIDALRRIGNATERDTLTMEIFGQSAQELNSIIKLGSAGLAEYAKRAETSGYVLSDTLVSDLQEADDATQRLTKANEALKNSLGAAFAPAVERGKNALAAFESGFAIAIQTVAEWNAKMNDAFQAVGEIWENGFIELWNDYFHITDSAEMSSKALVSITDAFSTSTDDATNSLRAYNEELERAAWAEMSLKEQREALIKQMTDAGLGREISRYDPDTGIIWSTFVNTNDAERYRRGETSFDTLYNESFSDHAARLQQAQQLPPVDITLEIDGRTLARTTYDAFEAEGNRRGPRAFS